MNQKDIKESLKAFKEKELTTTANGAKVYRTTKNQVLNFFYDITSLRFASEDDIVEKFTNSMFTNPPDTLKLLGYARDVRGGMGERRLFRVGMKRMVEVFKERINFQNLFDFIGDCGRYDDYVDIMHSVEDDDLYKQMATPLMIQFGKDVQSEHPSLLCKWLPSENASSKDTIEKATRLRTALNLSAKTYRKTLTRVRKKIWVVEQSLTNKDYTFDYQNVPSKAMLKYRNAFTRNDNERYLAYINAVNSGEAKMNMGVTYPYEIVSKYNKYGEEVGWKTIVKRLQPDLEAAWQSLKDMPIGGDAIAVLDTSGSMTASLGNGTETLISDVAESLAIYMAEHLNDCFKNKIITFSHDAKFIDLTGEETLKDKLNYIHTNNIVEDTNIESVLNLIFKTASENSLPQEALPSTIVIFSDMQFNMGVDNSDSYHKGFKRLSKRYGYKLPKIVYWNVSTCYGNQYPVQADEQGTILINGFSQNLFEMVTSGEISPMAALHAVIDKPKYEKFAKNFFVK